MDSISGMFTKEEENTVLRIVINSIYPYPVANIELVNSGQCYVNLTLQGPNLIFEKASDSNKGNIYMNMVKSIAYN